jgi:hypothetical protein
MDFLADSKRLAQLGLTILDDPPDICDYARHASAQNNTLNTAVPVPNSRAYSAIGVGISGRAGGSIECWV